MERAPNHASTIQPECRRMRTRCVGRLSFVGGRVTSSLDTRVASRNRWRCVCVCMHAYYAYACARRGLWPSQESRKGGEVCFAFRVEWIMDGEVPWNVERKENTISLFLSLSFSLRAAEDTVEETEQRIPERARKHADHKRNGSMAGGAGHAKRRGSGVCFFSRRSLESTPTGSRLCNKRR